MEDATNNSYSKLNNYLQTGANVLQTTGQVLSSLAAGKNSEDKEEQQGPLYAGDGKDPNWYQKANAYLQGYKNTNGTWVQRALGGPVPTRAHQYSRGGLSMAGSLTQGAGDALNNFVESSAVDTSAINSAKGQIRGKISDNVSANSLDSLMADYSADRKLKTDYNYHDFLGNSMGQRITMGSLNALNSGVNSALGSGNLGVGLASTGMGIIGNLFGSFRAKREAKNNATNANQIGATANMVQTQKYIDRATMLDAQNDRVRAQGYYATGGNLQTVGIENTPIQNIQVGQELSGLKASDLRALRQQGYKFDIIGD